ncbi:MAG: hypothetical protein LUG52_03820 [Clostridia bacterium]|nr:hypothetical protein [Clostridia bacterium]
MKKSDIFWQTYLNLEKEALDVSKYIFFTDEISVNCNGKIVTQPCKTQLETFSPYIADLLVRCCVQIEAISKELYFDSGGNKVRGDSSILFDADCLKLLDIKWQTHKKVVTIVAPSFNFTKDENRVLKPLKNAHKKQGTYWERAYQAVKHDRYSSLDKGNVKAFIQSLAALYLLNIYYRNDSWVTNYQDVPNKDYSLGSAIFSVPPPTRGLLWYGNNPVKSESPYVVKYSDAAYHRIEEMQQREDQALSEYWNKQPELEDPAFQDQLLKIMADAKSNPKKGIVPMWELTKYRLNRDIPDNLPFEEKKKLLISSKEWNGWIHQHNKHLNADELTPENIQKEIDSAAISWGIQLTNKYKKGEWISFATNNEICEVSIE